MKSKIIKEKFKRLKLIKSFNRNYLIKCLKFLIYFSKIKTKVVIITIIDLIFLTFAIKILLNKIDVKLIEEIYNDWTTVFKFTNILLTIFFSISSLKLIITIWKFFDFIRDNIKTYIDSDLSFDYLHSLNIKRTIEQETNNGYELKEFKLLDKQKEPPKIALYSKSINEKFLINKYININIIKRNKLENKNAVKHIKNNSKTLLPFLIHKLKNSTGNKILLNETKLCLTYDIANDPMSVTCNKGKYFDSFLTNDTFGRILIHNTNNNVISNTQHLLPLKYEKHYQTLLDITETQCSNHIGISILAVTKDNYLILPIQNVNANKSISNYVPSGSGSCDYLDLEKNEFLEYDLKNTIKYAMKRELEEECKIDRSYNSKNITLLGYYRWVSFSGKPEFTGFTKINKVKGPSQTNNEEILKYEYENFKNLNDFSLIFDKYFDNPKSSLPLNMNLLLLKEFIDKYPKRINAILELS